MILNLTAPGAINVAKNATTLKAGAIIWCNRSGLYDTQVATIFLDWDIATMKSSIIVKRVCLGDKCHLLTSLSNRNERCRDLWIGQEKESIY